MSMGNYPGNINYEEQGYTFNGTPQGFPAELDQTAYLSGQNSLMGIGLEGPGSHMEEAAASTVCVTSVSTKSGVGRGKRKGKKKNLSVDVNQDAIKLQRIEDLDVKNFTDSSSVPDMSDIQSMEGETLYPTEENSNSGTHPLFNSNTLDQILSYKKMQLLQSPEVMEYILNCQQTANSK